MQAQRFPICDFENGVEITDLPGLQGHLRTLPDRNIIQRRAFGQMFFKNQPEFLLFHQLVYFPSDSLPQLRGFDLAAIDCTPHNKTRALPVKGKAPAL